MARAKRAVSQPTSLPAPTGGWNARDSLANMNPQDAVNLVNWFPATTECTLRSGYEVWASGITGQVETLMAYSGGDTTELFAIAEGEVYDVSTAGPVGVAVLSGLSNSRWGYCNIATGAGTFLSMANGVDAPYVYDGSAWTNPTITGVTATSLRDPILYAERQFFIEDNSLKVWYLPVDSIAGAAQFVNVSSIATRGGYIVSHGTWTVDAGQGVNDHYVIMTSRGQVIVYQGIDPADIATWSMVGVWDIGAPIGFKALYKYAGDMLVICEDGLLPLSGALQSSRVQPRVALSDKIQYAISEAITAYGQNYGWQVMYVPTINQLWLNVPFQEGSQQQQFVMNTITGAWCNYTGWNVNCFEIFNDRPYMGGNGFVGLAYEGSSDAGANVQAYCLQAFSTFGNPGLVKRFTLARPIFRTDGLPSVYAGINVDFNIADVTAPLTFSPTPYGRWDVDKWDATLWGGGLGVLQNWQGLTGVGYYGAPVVKIASQGLQVRWVSTDIVIEGGAIL